MAKKYHAMKKLITFILLIISLTAQAETLIYQINIFDNINSKTWIYTDRGINEAEKMGANAIILHLNTYGGELKYADSIRTKILNCEIPVTAFIDNNAASAGALISIACDNIYMRPGANIGAATVVNGTDGAAMPDKYQSYMRSMMRSTAEAHGKDSLGNWIRNPRIAEAMVDDRIAIPNIIDSGKTLTFTTDEAIKYGYCEGKATNVKEVLEKEGYKDGSYMLETYQPTFWDKLKGILTSTILQSILIMLIIGGIYFELQTPGIGFPLAIAILAAILFFAPLYIDGLAAYWEIIIFFVGIILLLLEIFVIPGFGIAGISGIIFIIFGLTMSLLNNTNFDFSNVHLPDVSKALLTVIVGIILAFGLILYLSSKIGTKGLFRKLALQTSQPIKEGYIGVPTEQENLVGQKGTATTDLRPSGKVAIGNKRYDAIAENAGYITKGSEVEIIQYKTGQVYVRKA